MGQHWEVRRSGGCGFSPRAPELPLHLIPAPLSSNFQSTLLAGVNSTLPRLLPSRQPPSALESLPSASASLSAANTASAPTLQEYSVVIEPPCTYGSAGEGVISHSILTTSLDQAEIAHFRFPPPQNSSDLPSQGLTQGIPILTTFNVWADTF